jgi:glutathione synthase/RimK-type ligase-like ATP-grasp enzyme
MDGLKPALNRLALAVGERIPSGLRKPLLSLGPSFDLRGERRRAQDPFRFDPPEWRGSGRCPYVLGIFKEFWHMHWQYIAACRELDVSYKLLDISGPDWLDIVDNSGCDAFLARPSVQSSIWKQMYDERLRILASCRDYLIFPEVESLWLWESKRRMHDWLAAKDIPHPRTWVFYSLQSALEFAAECELPIVFKSDMGSGASGVLIFRRRKPLTRHIKRCFSKGYGTYRRARNDREYGSILLQEFLPDAQEWRTVRIGDSFFGYQKGNIAGFHSGSGVFLYGRPPDKVLDLTKRVTDEGQFRSLNVDIFIARDGRLLVNELQALFGQAGSREICRVDGQPGRMICSGEAGEWQFEPGTFCQNYLCNLRVATLLEMLGQRASDSSTQGQRELL